MRSQHDKKDDEKKVAQRLDLGLNFAVRRGTRQRDPGQQRADFNAETQKHQRGGYGKAPPTLVRNNNFASERHTS